MYCALEKENGGGVLFIQVKQFDFLVLNSGTRKASLRKRKLSRQVKDVEYVKKLEVLNMLKIARWKKGESELFCDEEENKIKQNTTQKQNMDHTVSHHTYNN